MRNSPWSSRPVSWTVTWAVVAAFIEWSPHKSVRKWSAELGVLHFTIFDHKRELVMKSFWPVFVIKLSDTDMRLCYKVCALLLECFLVVLSHGKVLFSDECAVYCISLSWNVFWGKTESWLHAWDVRPPTTHDDGAGVTASYIIGPYFFDGVVSGVTFIKCGIMIYQSQATMGLCNRCHFSKIVLQCISPGLCVKSSMNHYQVSVLVGVVQHPLHHCHGGHLVPTWAHLITACAPTLRCESSLLIPASLEHCEFHGWGQRMWWCIKLCEVHEGFPQGSAGSIQCVQDEINK